MDFQEWVKEAAKYFAETWGLEKGFAGQVALFFLYLASYGLNPQIQSGLRDPAHQKELLRRWEAGDRRGLKFKPAVNSDHTRGKAVDITTTNPRLAAQIAKALGLGAGLDYGDEVHFFKKG